MFGQGIDALYKAQTWRDLVVPGCGVLDYADHPTDVFAGFDYVSSEYRDLNGLLVGSDSKRCRRVIENVRRLYDSLPEEHRETALSLVLFSYQNGAHLFCEL